MFVIISTILKKYKNLKKYNKKVQKWQKIWKFGKKNSFLVIFGPLNPLLKFFEYFFINFLAFLKILIPIFWKSVKNSVHSNFLKCWLFIDQLSAYRYKHDVPQKLQSHIDRNKELLWTEFCTDFQNIGIKIFRKARRLIKKYSKNFRRGLTLYPSDIFLAVGA